MESIAQKAQRLNIQTSQKIEIETNQCALLFTETPEGVQLEAMVPDIQNFVGVPESLILCLAVTKLIAEYPERLKELAEETVNE